MRLQRWTLPTLAIVGMALPVPANEPRPLDLGHERVTYNQQIANEIARQFRSSGLLRSYRIDVSYTGGIAELSGTVAGDNQRDEALRLAHGVPGVNIVRNRLTVDETVKRTQMVALDEPLLVPTDGEVIGGPFQDPLPSFRATAPTYPAETLPPPMPPYAWPTYAPYNNFSRVAHPTSYPYQAFPFIGPVYPFPKVPLGWRSVKLEWDDGHWWLSNHAQQRDWWFLRYW